MAINPMQRRSRNMFLLGFIIALFIGVGISYFFYTKMKGAQEQKEALEALQKNVYYTSTELKSGEEIILSELESEYSEEESNDEQKEEAKEKRGVLELKKIQTSIDSESLIDASMFTYDYKPDNVEEKYEKYSDSEKESENQKEDLYKRYYKKIRMKIDVPAGTIITKDMIEEVDEPTTSDQRLQEYNMIILPTLLEEGNYVDIRLALPTGEDYVVISKKKVYKATADTIWLKMREDEILTIGNSIVEAYLLPGSKLYATIYTEPGRQKASEVTYVANDEVMRLIDKGQNIVEEARNEIISRYNNDKELYRAQINNLIGQIEEGKEETIEAGVQEEITKLQSSRQQYVQDLQAGSASESTEVEE